MLDLADGGFGVAALQHMRCVRYNEGTEDRRDRIRPHIVSYPSFLQSQWLRRKDQKQRRAERVCLDQRAQNTVVWVI